MYLFINTTQEDSMIMLFNNKNIIDSFIWKSNNSQSEELLINIDKVIKNNNKSLNDLKGIIVITGPGSYTGIRVGVATANALAFSLNINIFGIDILEILSAYYFEQISKSKEVIVLVHAIYNKYYYAKYYQNNSKKISRQVIGKEELKKIMQNNEVESLALQAREETLEMGSVVELSNIDFQKSIVKYIAKLLSKTKKRNYVHPFYLNQPNITKPK